MEDGSCEQNNEAYMVSTRGGVCTDAGSHGHVL